MAAEANRGKTALDAKDYPLAIKHFTNALKESQSPVWLVHRSTAYQRNQEYELALADADNAVIAAVKRARREQIATAQFRRAIALHGLKRFGDARRCLNWCSKINDKEKGLTLWMGLIKKDYDEAGGADGESNSVTVKEIPDPVVEVKANEEKKQEEKVDKGKGKAIEADRTVPTAAAPVRPPVPTSKEKIRHEWYQSTTSVTIDLLASGVGKGKVEVIFQERSLEVSFPVAGASSTFDFTLSPLYGSIVPEKCSFRVTPRKIEISLIKKAATVTKWSGLEWKAGLNPLEPNDPTALNSNPEVPAVPHGLLSPSSTTSEPKAPAYPTSSRTGPKNWDTIGVDDEEEDNDPDSFFKKLYKNSDDNTKKAMMKSMQESGGTSLSTVWDDVSSKTFTPVPPEGMEAKKY